MKAAFVGLLHLENTVVMFIFKLVTSDLMKEQ